MISKIALTFYISLTASVATAQSGLSNSFLRSEGRDSGNRRYDFTNVQKRAGHLIEKENDWEKNVMDTLEANMDMQNMDVEQYDAMVVEQLDSVSMIE